MTNNLCILMGNLGKDPELRTGGTTEICRFSLATRRAGPDKKDVTDWHNCVAFGKAAESIHRYFRKGMRIQIIGNIRNGSYEDKDHIATSVHLNTDDLDYTPFDALGGRGKMWQLFGNDMEIIIEELNEALIA